jgi:O-antigen/teichoic acid export membrane protein
MRAARGFAFRLGSELSTKLLSLGVTVWLTRSLGPEAWGRMQWSLALAALAAAFADFGLASLALREISRAGAAERPGWMRAAWTLKSLLGAGVLLAFGIGLAFRPADEWGLLTAALAYTAMLSACGLCSFFFVGLQRLDADFQVTLAGRLGQAAAALAALSLGWGPAGVLFAMAGAGLAGWIGGLSRLRKLAGPAAARPGTAEKMRALWSGLWPFGLAPVVALAAAKADSLLIRQILGDGSLGVYQSAYKWLEAIAFVPVALMHAVYADMSRGASQKGGEAGARKVVALLATMAALAVPFLWALAAQLPRILGEAYGASPALLRILALSCLANFPNFALNNLLVVHGRQGKVLAVLSVGLAFNLAANACFLPRYGAAAAAWATAGTEGVMALTALYFLAGRHQAAPVLLLLAKAAAAAAAGAGLAFAMRGAPLPSLFSLALAPALSLALAFSLGLLSREAVAKAWGALRGARP